MYFFQNNYLLVQFLSYLNIQGIFHLKSINKISRFELAKKINKYFKFNNLINKCSINSIGLKEKRGLKLNLNTQKYSNVFKFKDKNFIVSTNDGYLIK